MTELLQGDCLELLRDVPAESVDMVLCDPPFGSTQNAWDCVIPTPPLWENLTRVCKPNAAMLFFAQMPFAAELVTSNRKMFRYEWIWQKSNKTGFLNAKKMPLKEHENILVFYRKAPTYNPQMVKGERHSRAAGKRSNNYGAFHPVLSWSDEYYPGDIITFPCIFHTAEKQAHPTQKPVPLLEYLIRTYTNPDETVLDCCMGSGSTGVACGNTGRGFIGMELDAGYFAIAQERIQAAKDAIALEGAQERIDI